MSKFPIAPTPKPTKFDLELEAQRAEFGNFGAWLKKNPPPDLQDLVEQYGGYNKITAEAWKGFDDRTRDWLAAVRLRGGLIPVASGLPGHNGAAAIRIKNKYAALYAARLRPGEAVELPEAPFLHLFVARGTVTLEGAGSLAEGDAVRFTATGGQQVTATEPAEILVWEMHATIAGW